MLQSEQELQCRPRCSTNAAYCDVCNSSGQQCSRLPRTALCQRNLQQGDESCDHQHLYVYRDRTKWRECSRGKSPMHWRLISPPLRLRAILAPNTSFNAMITTAATDTYGNTVEANFEWTFTTSASCIVAPAVTVVSPANGTCPEMAVVSAEFSQAMNPATINISTFTLTTCTLTGPSVATWLAQSPTLQQPRSPPSRPRLVLHRVQRYTATITTGVANTPGDSLAAAKGLDLHDLHLVCDYSAYRDDRNSAEQRHSDLPQYGGRQRGVRQSDEPRDHHQFNIYADSRRDERGRHSHLCCGDRYCHLYTHG